MEEDPSVMPSDDRGLRETYGEEPHAQVLLKLLTNRNQKDHELFLIFLNLKFGVIRYTAINK